MEFIQEGSTRVKLRPPDTALLSENFVVITLFMILVISHMHSYPYYLKLRSSKQHSTENENQAPQAVEEKPYEVL